jgi:hypothetical protein
MTTFWLDSVMTVSSDLAGDKQNQNLIEVPENMFSESNK